MLVAGSKIVNPFFFIIPLFTGSKIVNPFLFHNSSLCRIKDINPFCFIIPLFAGSKIVNPFLFHNSSLCRIKDSKPLPVSGGVWDLGSVYWWGVDRGPANSSLPERLLAEEQTCHHRLVSSLLPSANHERCGNTGHCFYELKSCSLRCWSHVAMAEVSRLAWSVHLWQIRL